MLQYALFDLVAKLNVNCYETAMSTEIYAQYQGMKSMNQITRKYLISNRSNENLYSPYNGSIKTEQTALIKLN